MNQSSRTGLYQHNAYKDDFGITGTGEQTITAEQDEIEDILKKFPFYGRNSERQITVLSGYLIEALGNNKKDTAEKLDVNRNTVTKIEESWRSIPVGEKVKLINFLQKECAKRHFSSVETQSVDPEIA